MNISYVSKESCNIERKLKICYVVLKQYSWLTDAYVLDFFVKNHWDKLLKSWSTFVDCLSLETLANILDTSRPLSCCCNIVVPLSLSCLRELLKNLCLPRSCVATKESGGTEEFYANEKLMNLFWKNVKIKKRHEIMEMAKLCYSTASECNCFCIIDVGSGLGHLSRILAYGYKFNVLSIEASENLSQQARKLDCNLRKCALKYLGGDIGKVAYLNSRIEGNSNGDSILEYFRELLLLEQKENVHFGLVGLHPCGDLASLLLKLYKGCDRIRFINIASCCYMKLTTPSSTLEHSFPISSYCKNNNFSLTYNDREIACHAIEMYIDKLQCGQHDDLKIHAYRAALEKIIVSQRPDLSHSHLSNIKYREGLNFDEYCRNAVVKLGIKIQDEVARSENAIKDLSEWGRVVKFYTMRLMLAPLIETVILLDRYLYMEEEIGGINKIIGAFEPRLSPRNLILNGIKHS